MRPPSGGLFVYDARRMRESDNVFLIGPMGSGKTAVGKQLAKLLGWPFFDSDHEVVTATGADIPLIFEREGEEGFRRRESEQIARLTQGHHVVLATGGGAVLNAGNREHLRQRGWVVFLETSVDQQARRAARTGQRPLLYGHDPRQRLQQLWQLREPLYRDIADCTVNTDNQRVAAVADTILAAYREANPEASS
jgi:shikimate kinase